MSAAGTSAAGPLSRAGPLSVVGGSWSVRGTGGSAMRAVRGGLSIIGAALVAVSVVGCGTQRADAAVVVRDAAAKTASARTARLALSVDSTSSNAPATTA